MHTEWNITRIQYYITAHRGLIALMVGATLAIGVSLGWYVLAPVVLHIHAPTLALCVTALAILGGGVTALATYWGTDE